MQNAEQIRLYIEELTLVFEQIGLPRTAARILVWLLVCEPDEQTMNDLMDALQLSKSSVSAATQTLIQYRLVERVSLPGQRRDYYRVQAGVWTRLLAARMDEVRRLREMAEKGLRLIDPEDTTKPDRLHEMHIYVEFLEQEFSSILSRWEERQLQRKPKIDPR